MSWSFTAVEIEHENEIQGGSRCCVRKDLAPPRQGTLQQGRGGDHSGFCRRMSRIGEKNRNNADLCQGEKLTGEKLWKYGDKRR
jgi:hypothetical protein